MAGGRPEVSVVLPVYNAAATLPRALASIRSQTLEDWELVAVDDGSSDPSRSLLEAEAAVDPRIRVFKQPHGGVVPAANRAHAEARGRLVARMDADDAMQPERLAEQASFLLDHPRIDFVGCQVAFGGDRRSAEGFARHVDWINSVLTPEEHAAAQFLEYPLAHPSLMARREAWERAGPFRDGDFPEDYEWFLRAMEAGLRFAKVPARLLVWHDPEDRLTRTDPRYAVEAFFAAKIPFLVRWLRRHVPAERPLVVWGSGRVTRRRLRPLLAHDLPLAGWIDVDPRKVGGVADGLPVRPPESLRTAPVPFVLTAVRSRGAREKIRRHLHADGLAPLRDYLELA